MIGEFTKRIKAAGGGAQNVWTRSKEGIELINTADVVSKCAD